MDTLEPKLSIRALAAAARDRHGLTYAGVAQVLGVKPRTLYLWALEGRMPPGPQRPCLAWLAGELDDVGLVTVFGRRLFEAAKAHSAGPRDVRRDVTLDLFEAPRPRARRKVDPLFA